MDVRATTEDQMTGTDELLVEARGHLAILTLNRPEKGNALNESLLDSLADALAGLATEESLRCVILKGSGDRFSVGMDLSAMMELTPDQNQQLIGAGGPLRRAIAEIEDFPYPVIAMITGYAAGAACELAISCDLRVGCGLTRMGMPPARLGIVYPPEGIERFVLTVGLPVTRRLFLTARYFEASELYAMGMLDFLCGDELEGFTVELAGEVSALAPLAMRGHKRALRAVARSVAPRMDDSERAEIDELMIHAMSSEDASEGLAAFIAKRQSRFKG
jgi:enoyl-CoA hydratase/carnithine racemase